MSRQALRLDLISKTDSKENEYFFTRVNLPVLLDLSDTVIFVHPFENEDGTSGAEMVIKQYTGDKVRNRNVSAEVAIKDVDPDPEEHTS